VGFAPGFAYLGELDPKLVLPRRAEPRPRVPAGAVAIGGAHTGVYPFATPGGWHLIGRTDAVLFDSHRAAPALLRVGDRVRFEPVSP
jgi:KipI family sensor histidine kinase inhibitor